MSIYPTTVWLGDNDCAANVMTKLTYRDQQEVNKLHQEMAEKNFIAKSLLAKSPTVAEALIQRVNEIQDRINEIYEIGSDYR